MQRVDHPAPAAANSEALHDLENGATGLSVVFAGAVGAYRYGLPASEKVIARALDGIHLEAGIAADLELGSQTPDTGHLLAALLKRRGVRPANTNIRFGFDPIGIAAIGGANPLPSSDHVATLNRVISDLTAEGFRGPFAAADGRVIHNAGGSEAQELAYVLAAAVQNLRLLQAGGGPLPVAPPPLYFSPAARAGGVLFPTKISAPGAL